MDRLSLPPTETEPLSREGPLCSERWSWLHFAASQQAKSHRAFPLCGGRQVASSWTRDGDHLRGCKFSLPLQTVCLSFLSYVCSPAAHAQGNKEDALGPRAKPWVSANWSLLLLSQYSSVAQKHPFLYLLYWFERLWPTQTKNLEVLRSLTSQPCMTANKRWTPSITAVISFLRYAIYDSRTVTAHNKFSF